MATISLATIVAYWKNISDWVKGTDATSAPKVSVVKMGQQLVSGSYDTALTTVAGGSTTIAITPPSGEFWRIKGIFVEIPPPSGATNGTHRVDIRQGSSASANTKIRARSQRTTKIEFSLGRIYVADFEQQPTTEVGQMMAFAGLVAANTRPINLVYFNNTDAAQDQTIQITVTREVETIV